MSFKEGVHQNDLGLDGASGQEQVTAPVSMVGRPGTQIFAL